MEVAPPLISLLAGAPRKFSRRRDLERPAKNLLPPGPNLNHLRTTGRDIQDKLCTTGDSLHPPLSGLDL